ncbi:MAG TPA: FAD-binding protein, partial [Pyrinomonadaceae bacterium]|nr:FAD-binding protein [Pyrinomonadaceae bacterium]
SGSSISVPSEWFGARGEALGLSRAEMDHRLLRRAHDAGADALEDAQATGLIIEGGRVRGVRLRASGEEFECSSLVVVDATGRRRALARDVEREENNGRHARRKRRASLVAFKIHLEGARGAEGGCEIYSYRGGYGGLSRVEGGLSNLCFIASARDVRACGSDPEKVLREVLMTNRRAAYTLDRARPASQWLSVALESFGRRTVVPADGLLVVGDAASFIDPFTGSGILMALESGELAADVIARWLPRISEGEPFGPLACEYRALYYERFKTRLRVCTLLRRAAFVPGLAEVVISTLGASERFRRRLARATRRASLRAARDAAG